MYCSNKNLQDVSAWLLAVVPLLQFHGYVGEGVAGDRSSLTSVGK